MPGLDVELPSSLKSHLLFDFHLQDFLEKWGTLGGFDEQNIESTHPVFNQLVRQYGCTCGRELKINVIRGFYFKKASFMLESVDNMIKETSRAKRRNTIKRGKRVVSKDTVKESTSLLLTELTLMEQEMNANERLHPGPAHEQNPFPDTRICACDKCGKRVIAFGLESHDHEYHSGGIVGEVDDAVIQRMKFEASL